MSRVLRREWGCKPFDSGGVNGVQFPPLGELRRMFEKKHGPQPWTDVVDWMLKTGGTMPPKQDELIPF